jgi:hypothetical protein
MTQQNQNQNQPSRPSTDPADPHGAAPARESAKHKPKAMPTDDRHQTETAVHSPDNSDGSKG